jgi:site-specific recombinase XerD
MPATLRYVLKTDRSNSRNESPIYLRITLNRKKRYYNTGIRLEPSDWNEEKEKIRRSHRNYRQINDELDILMEKAKSAGRLLRRENKESAEAIKERIIGASKKNFFKLAEDHLEDLKRNEQFYLHKQTNATINKLTKFNGSKNLLFTEINSQYLSKFQDHMKKDLGNKGSTIRKNMSDVHRIVKLAMDKQLIFQDPFDAVKPVKVNKPKYKSKLSLEEIKKIEDLNLPEGEMVWHARNAFVLSFYFCGMRFGDIATLEWKNVSGKLEYQMNKTGVNINIKLLEGAKPILKMYDRPGKKPEDYVFPFCEEANRKDKNDIKRKISSKNAYVNDKLDDIAKGAEIDKNLSMHVARHSFAQYGANKGISLYKMMILLGHQSIKTTENYLDSINVQIGNDTLNEIF